MEPSVQNEPRDSRKTPELGTSGGAAGAGEPDGSGGSHRSVVVESPQLPRRFSVPTVQRQSGTLDSGVQKVEETKKPAVHIQRADFNGSWRTVTIILGPLGEVAQRK